MFCACVQVSTIEESSTQELKVLRGSYDKELAHTRRALDETGRDIQHTLIGLFSMNSKFFRSIIDTSTYFHSYFIALK